MLGVGKFDEVAQALRDLLDGCEPSKYRSIWHPKGKSEGLLHSID